MTGRQRLRPMRRLLGSVLLLGFVSALLLAAGEGVVRAFQIHGDNFVRRDRWTGWVHEPGAKGLYVSPEARAPVEYNSLGLRGPEIPRDKPAGVRRLLLLGDSFTESEQVPYADTWGARLEEHLGPGWQTLNAGVAGYGTDNALLWLRRYGWELQPDAVLLLFFTGNDVSDNDAALGRQSGTWLPQPVFRLADASAPGDASDASALGDASATGDASASRDRLGALVLEDYPLPEHRPGALGRLKDALRERSRLYLFARDTLYEFRARRAHASGVRGSRGDRDSDVRAGSRVGEGTSDGSPASGEVPRAWHVYRTDIDPDWTRAWELTRHLLAAMAAECREREVPFTVAILPTGWRIDPEQRARIAEQHPELVSGDGWQLDLPDRKLEAILSELGVPSLDLATPLLTAAAISPEPLYGDHLTARGHRVVASALASFLDMEDQSPAPHRTRLSFPPAKSTPSSSIR